MDSLWSIGKGDSLISTVSSYIFLNDGEHKIKHSFQDAFTGDEFTASWDIRQGTKSGVMMPNTESGAGNTSTRAISRTPYKLLSSTVN
jgi:hypothetical protein